MTFNDTTAPTHVEIWTDGACIGNPGPGGWAYEKHCGGRTKRASGGVSGETTNIQMEMVAVIQAVRSLTRPDLPATIYSDSAHVVDGVNKWLDGWVAAGWMKRDGKPLQNVELWKHLWGLLEARAGAAPLSFVHVKAHAGEPRNEAVDRLANGAARVAAKDFYPECPMPTQFDPERGLVVPVWGPKDFEE